MLTKPAKNCDLLVFGETTLDTISQVEGTPFPESAACEIMSMTGPSLGGRGSNVGTYASVFGLDVVLISACGNDFVDKYAAFPIGSRVKMGHVFHDEGENDTAKALVFRNEKTQRAATYFYPGLMKRKKDEYFVHIRESVKSLCPRCVFCTSESYGMVEEILQSFGSSMSILKAFAPGPEVETLHDNITRLDKILRLTDVLFVNLNEKMSIELMLKKSVADILMACNLKAIVVTFAQAGALLVIKEGGRAINKFLPSYHLRVTKDATGAGDALAGAFIGYYLSAPRRSRNMFDALKYGIAVSSIVVQTEGCLVEDLTMDQIKKRHSDYVKQLGLEES